MLLVLRCGPDLRKAALASMIRDTRDAMSEEEGEIVRGVRTQLAASSENRRRTLDERVMVRFPRLVRRLASACSRLPPCSRLRRAWISRLGRRGSQATNRKDFELLLLFFDPEIEFRVPRSRGGDFVPPDLLGVHRGREGYLRVWEGLIDAWDELKVEPQEIIDFGDRVLAAGRIKGRGRYSGIALDEPLFQVFTLRRGLVVRQEDFADRDDALQAAGRQ
jgi:ketosteroid isomerase-like protein